MFPIILAAHSSLATTATLFTAALTLWGFFRFFRRQGVSGSYYGSLAVGEILLLVNAGIGIALSAGGGRTGNDYLHILYGICNIIAIPGLYAYLRDADGRREMLLWAVLMLFVFGLTLRARITGA